MRKMLLLQISVLTHSCLQNHKAYLQMPVHYSFKCFFQSYKSVSSM